MQNFEIKDKNSLTFVNIGFMLCMDILLLRFFSNIRFATDIKLYIMLV